MEQSIQKCLGGALGLGLGVVWMAGGAGAAFVCLVLALAGYLGVGGLQGGLPGRLRGSALAALGRIRELERARPRGLPNALAYAGRRERGQHSRRHPATRGALAIEDPSSEQSVVGGYGW